MFSKSLKPSFLIISLNFLVLLGACSWWGGSEKNKKSSNVSFISTDIFGESGECLSEIDDFFIKYFKGVTTEFDIEESVKCVESSLDTLFENTLEVDASKGFSRAELINILKKIWKDKSLGTIEMSVETIFLAKRLFVGGAKNGFTRTDLRNFKTIIPDIKNALINSNEHIKFWLFGVKESDSQRPKSLQVVYENMKVLDLVRLEAGASFTKKEAYKLFEIIFAAESLSGFQKLVFLAFDFFFGDDKSFESSQQEIFQRIHIALETQAVLTAAKFPRGLFFGDGLERVTSGLVKVLEYFKTWSKKDTNFYVSTENIKNIISEVYIISGDAKEEHPIATTSTQFLEKLFKTKELKENSFGILLDAIKTWYFGQQDIINNYRPEGVKFNFSEYKFSEKNILQALLILDSVEETKKSYFLRRSDGTIQYIYNRGSRDSLSKDIKYYDLSLKNLFANFAYRAFEAYVKDREGPLKQVQVSKSELGELMLDIRPLALDMGITNPYSCNAADNFMQDANLFTNSGDGNDTLSFIEGIELVYMSYSASGLSKKVYNSIDVSCEIGGMTYLGSPFMDRQCVKDSIFSGEHVFISSFNEFNDYYGIIKNETSRDDWHYRLGWVTPSWLYEDWSYKQSNPANLQNLIFSLVNSCEDVDTPITKQEIQTMVGLVQYIENWFSIYDNSGQGVFLARNWWDEEDYDYVLDGKEIKTLFNDRLANIYYKGRVVGDDYSSIWNSVKSAGRNTLNYIGEKGTNINLGASDLDRYRALVLLEEQIKNASTSNTPHVYLKDFCNSVVSSYKNSGAISYNKNNVLRCDGTDEATD